MKEPLATEVRKYLEHVAGLRPTLAAFPPAKVPIFLRERYSLAEGDVLHHRCLFFSPHRNFPEWTPAAVATDRRLLEALQLGIPVFVSTEMRANQRRSLIEKRVPFINPGYQLYLPDLLIDLREYFAGQRAKPPKTLTPSAQHLLLMAIEQHIERFGSARAIGDRLPYTAMTVGRAMDELADLELAEIGKDGKNKILAFPAGEHGVDWRALWERALPHLQSPVGRSLRLTPGKLSTEILKNARLAGISALGRYSMLNEPPVETWAISADWYGKHAVAIEQAEASEWAESSDERLEIWSYDPGLSGDAPKTWLRDSLSGRKGIVDRLSLYLSLRNSEDERIEQALEQMMEDIPW